LYETSKNESYGETFRLERHKELSSRIDAIDERESYILSIG